MESLTIEEEKMKVAILSHSNVHPRQIRFFKELSKHCSVLLVAPESWGNLKPKMELIKTEEMDFKLCAFPVLTQGNIYSFLWRHKTYDRIMEFNPDVIYCVSEWQSMAARQVMDWSKQIGCKFVLFTWDNLNFPKGSERGFLRNCDLVICGNNDALNICRVAHAKVAMCLHVGVDINLFKPKQMKKDIDVLCVGREVPEKGVEFIRRAYPGVKFLSGVGYEELPEWFNHAKLHVTFPFTISTWKEQSMGYVTAEAMACGLSVVSADCGGVSEYLRRSSANILQQKDLGALKKRIKFLLSDSDVRDKEGVMNRDFIVNNYSNEVVAKKLFEVLKNV